MYWLDLIGGFELPAEKMPKFGIILPGSARGSAHDFRSIQAWYEPTSAQKIDWRPEVITYRISTIIYIYIPRPSAGRFFSPKLFRLKFWPEWIFFAWGGFFCPIVFLVILMILVKMRAHTIYCWYIVDNSVKEVYCFTWKSHFGCFRLVRGCFRPFRGCFRPKKI